jgi:hypothetical protein
MAIAMLFEVQGLTEEQYDAALREVASRRQDRYSTLPDRCRAAGGYCRCGSPQRQQTLSTARSSNRPCVLQA